MALLDETLAWLDPHWDPDAALLWAPPGAFDELGGVHLVPQSAWYATGLARRGDRERVLETLDALCDLQYDDPGTPWHGTFARFAEWPHPTEGAVEWVDYDPNWRQFLGCAFAVLLRTEDLPAALADRLRAAIALACDGEPANRAGAWYTNIALMRAWLEAHHGDRDRAEALRHELVERFARHGAFDEYNSPTYVGLDLYALALWRTHPASADMERDGERLEAAHWWDLARWYHPGLGNLCGPYSRAYGMDMSRYASLLGLWLWRTLGDAPFPPLEGPVDHGHDVAFAGCIEGLGPRIPDEALEDLRTFGGEHTVHQELPGGRTATGWLAPDVMIGAESGGAWPAGGQYHPATIHWRAPEEIGWIRVLHPGPVDAVARPGELLIEPGSDAETTLLFSSSEAAPRLEGDRLTLPGIDEVVRLRTSGEGLALAAFSD